MTMKLIHRRDVIKGVRERFRAQYANYSRSHRFQADKPSIREILTNLDTLDTSTCTPEEVIAAMGGLNWIGHECDECGQTFETLIVVGEEPDYEARYQDLCKGCVTKALALFP